MARGNGKTLIRYTVASLAFLLTLGIWTGSAAWALIIGGVGNEPMRDPGWPKGAAAVFNTPQRVAFWEGPPFGGGQYHAECRGDDAALQQVIDDFAKIDSPLKRLVVHDGVGQSLWLNSNREPDKVKEAQIDWIFMVWIPERRKMQRQLPVGFSAVGKRDPAILAQLDIYSGGSIHWDKIKVPEEIEVLDQRLEAHGFTLEDGVVLEGQTTDLVTNQPLRAEIELQRIEPQKAGGYLYPKELSANADDTGHWVLKQVPPGWYRLVLRADGYAPRVIGHHRFEGQPVWTEHDAGLSKPGTVSGVVIDDQGHPVADAFVHLDVIDVQQTGAYESPNETQVKTGSDGKFSFESLAVGPTKVHVHKSGYVGPALGQKIEVPASDLRVQMQPAATLKVTVDFGKRKPGNYLVHVEPEGGEQIGKWSGDGMVDAEGTITFQSVPAGTYVLYGRPNPGRTDEQTDAETVQLKGGETTEVAIKAR